MGPPRRLLQQIANAGFSPAAGPVQEAAAGARRESPVRWVWVGLFAAVYFGLLAMDPRHRRELPDSPAPTTLAAFLLLLAGCLALWWWRPFQRLVLRPGHSLMEIRPLHALLTFISATMSLAWSIWALVAWTRGMH